MIAFITLTVIYHPCLRVAQIHVDLSSRFSNPAQIHVDLRSRGFPGFDGIVIIILIQNDVLQMRSFGHSISLTTY